MLRFIAISFLIHAAFICAWMSFLAPKQIALLVRPSLIEIETMENGHHKARPIVGSRAAGGRRASQTLRNSLNEDRVSLVRQSDVTSLPPPTSAITARTLEDWGNRSPEYPQAAVQSEIQGSVGIRFHLDRSGRAEEVQLTQSSGHRILDESALLAARQWHGPSVLGDFANRWFVVSLNFKLE